MGRSVGVASSLSFCEATELFPLLAVCQWLCQDTWFALHCSTKRAAGLRNAEFRCGMGMALALWLGSVVRAKVRVRVSLTIWVIVLFCRNTVPFRVFYVFHIYIPQFCTVPFPI